MSWDNLDLLREREAVLANGGRLPLADAVDHLLRLQAAVGADDQEWDVLYHFRELALDRPVDEAVRRSLARDHFLGPDGAIDAGLRDVILSAVRGQDWSLHLESPFTDSLDRALAEYELARQTVVAAADLHQLDPVQARQFFAPSRFERAMDGLKPRPDDVRAEARDPLPHDDALQIPPHLGDARSFADRVMKRIDQLPPGSPPPPPK